MPTSLTIRELLKRAADYLGEKGIESPRLTSELLLAHRLKVDRVSLYLNLDQPLTESEISGFRSLVKRRLKREPVQYIIGSQEFWSLEFTVGPGVLVPRPETELLVEQSVHLFKEALMPESIHPKILEIGTGSGALAVSLAKEIPEAEILATDIDPEALDRARFNAEKHHVSQHITFLQGNLWEPLSASEQGSFDLVLSNPPYVSSEEYDELPPEVRDFEPRIALDGGEGGMIYIERIIADAHLYLKPGGWLLLEMAPSQTENALDLIKRSGRYDEQTRIKDYSHRWRVVKARKHPVS